MQVEFVTVPADQLRQIVAEAVAAGVAKAQAASLDREERLERQLSAHSRGLLTLQQVADQYGRAPGTYRRWISQGRLKAAGKDPSGGWLVTRAAAEAALVDVPAEEL